MTLKLALIDDDFLLLDLMQQFLRQQQGFEVLFTACGGQEALEQLSQHSSLPALILLDLKMPDMNGLDLLLQLKNLYPALAVIIISSHYQAHNLSYMIQHGVAAFLPKGVSLSLLLRVIQEVHRHGFYLLPEQVETLRHQVAQATVAPDLSNYGLTAREIEVLKLIAHQKTAKEIAEKLFIAARTVEGHKNNLFAKTGTKNIAGLVIFGIQTKIIRLDEIILFP